MSSGSLILLTGISGFLGAHIASQLLEAGYRVRGTARSKKVSSLQARYAHYGNKVEIVGVDDLLHGDYSAALKGVEAIIHAAAPLPGRSASYQEQLDAGVEGTLNILRQGEKAGIKKISIVSSIVAITSLGALDPIPVLSEKIWNPVTREQGLDPSESPFTVYCVEKTLAEQAAWEFADKHPHVDILTICPPTFIGPFAPEWAVEQPDINALSTNAHIYDLLRPDGPRIPPPLITVDVRDVARSLVLSLTAPPESKVGRKRIPISGERFSSRQAVEYIAEVRPALKDRLSKDAALAPPVQKTNIDTTRAREVLGLEPTDWHKSLLDAVDSLIAIETEWLSKGWNPPNTTASAGPSL